MGKCVALVEWNWIGHTPTFFAFFVLALEELGADVLAICPHPGETRETLAQLRLQRGLGPSREGQITYLQMEIPARRFRVLRPRRISLIDWSIRHFRSIEAAARKWEEESGKRLDLIFFTCMFDSDFRWFQLTQPFWSLPWAGFYLETLSPGQPGQFSFGSQHPPHPEKIFRGSLCKAIFAPDVASAPPLAAITGKPVVVLPNLTDERLPAPASGRSLENGLKQFADGRPVVGLFGHLRKSKGLLPLLAVSQLPAMSKVCFALGGEVAWSHYSPDETETIRRVLAGGANLWKHLQRIPDEEELNSLLSACNVIYAAYLDFPNSSNIMTKAAFFKKPVIVSDGHLMADEVRRFNLGEIIPQGDPPALAGAILKITRNPEAWVAENQPRWDDYHRDHSYERFQEAMRGLLAGL